MSSRQARRERRAAEHRKRKLLQKQNRVLAMAARPDEAELTPELIAEARAARERVARRIGCPAPPSPIETRFVSQDAAPNKSRAEINRANAAHSTGPRSPEGLATSSRNSLKHGLASGTLIIPGEDQAEFEDLLQSLLSDHQPANSTETLLVQEMAQSFWLTQRALRLQNECFTMDGIDERRLALFLRYQTTHEGAFHKALNALIRLQKERRRENHGFVSHQRASADPQIGFVSQNSHQSVQSPPNAALKSIRKDQPTSHVA